MNMRNDQNEETRIQEAEGTLPEWMRISESYAPQTDKEAFLTKSIEAVLKTLAKLSFQEGKERGQSVSPSLKLSGTMLLILLTACSRNYVFVLLMCGAVTIRLAFFSADALRQIVSTTLGAVLFSMLLLLPAVCMGNPRAIINITTRVYVSVTLIGILSAGTSWNRLSAGMREFHIPSLFIFTLDITLKYITILGGLCGDILTSLRMRSIGKNPDKAKSLSGVLGITFLKSQEMAQEMHAAMCCRGFTGEYEKKRKREQCSGNLLFVVLLAGSFGVFWYLNSSI